MYSSVYLFLFREKVILFDAKEIRGVAPHSDGVRLCTHERFFTYGILLTQVSNALFLFYSYAVITPILGYIFLKEKLGFSNVTASLISIVGLVLLYQPNSFATWKIGGLFALLSALGQSAYIIARKKLPEYSAGFMLLANTVVGVVVVGIMSLVFENQFYFQYQLSQISLHTWTVTVLFGIDNFFAWLAMTKDFEYFQATMGSLILLTEIIFGVVLALIIFAEIPTMVTLFGGVLILTASILVIMKRK